MENSYILWLMMKIISSFFIIFCSFLSFAFAQQVKEERIDDIIIRDIKRLNEKEDNKQSLNNETASDFQSNSDLDINLDILDEDFNNKAFELMGLFIVKSAFKDEYDKKCINKDELLDIDQILVCAAVKGVLDIPNDELLKSYESGNDNVVQFYIIKSIRNSEKTFRNYCEKGDKKISKTTCCRIKKLSTLSDNAILDYLNRDDDSFDKYLDNDCSNL